MFFASAEAKSPAKQHKTVRKTALTEYKNSIKQRPFAKQAESFDTILRP